MARIVALDTSDVRFPTSLSSLARRCREAVTDGCTQAKLNLAEDIRRLGEHSATPDEVAAGRYRAPKAPGAGAQPLDRSIVEYAHG